jgi:hypothetical protein
MRGGKGGKEREKGGREGGREGRRDVPSADVHVAIVADDGRVAPAGDHLEGGREGGRAGGVV